MVMVVTKKKKAHVKPPAKSAAPIVVTMLVDESGSMEHLAKATMEGFNAYVDKLKKDGAKGVFTAFKFDTRGTRVIQDGASISEAMHLTPDNYQPHGGTPLYDAISVAVAKTNELVRARDGAKAIVVIQTDGEENASYIQNLSSIKCLIEQHQGRGWQFVFIGAGINAFVDGQKMGIQAVNTMSYAPTSLGTQNVFHAMAQNTRLYASGSTGGMAFSASQSALAGEDARVTRAKMARVKTPA